MFVYKHTEKIEHRILLFFKKKKTSQVSKWRILRIKNAKLSGYCFYMNRTYTEIFKSALVYL